MIVRDSRRVGIPERGADDGRWIVPHVDMPDDRRIIVGSRSAIPSRSPHAHADRLPDGSHTVREGQRPDGQWNGRSDGSWNRRRLVEMTVIVVGPNA
jgi:hypothetical protein